MSSSTAFKKASLGALLEVLVLTAGSRDVNAVDSCVLNPYCSSLTGQELIDQDNAYPVGKSALFWVSPDNTRLSSALSTALQAWNDATGITSLHTTGVTPADAIVAAATNIHDYFNDPDALAGNKIILGVPYIFVDWQKDWSGTCPSMLDLESVLVHEVGHSLGLDDYPVENLWMGCNMEVDDGPENCTVMTGCGEGHDCERTPRALDVLAIYCRFGVRELSWGEMKGEYGSHYYPFDKALALSGSGNTVVWKKPNIPSEDGYRIYRSEGESESAELIGTVGGADSSFADTTSEFGKAYTYHVASFDGPSLAEVGTPSAALKLVKDYIIDDVMNTALARDAQLAVRGSVLYAALETSSGSYEIRKFDVSNPLAIVQLGRRTGLTWIDGMCLSEDGSKLYVQTYTGFMILNATQNGLPILGQLSNIVSGTDSDQMADMAVDGDAVFLACGVRGVLAISVDKPNMPSIVGRFDPDGAFHTDKTIWDVQMNSGKLYATERNQDGSGMRCDRLSVHREYAIPNALIPGLIDVSFEVECTSDNPSCWTGFSAGTSMVGRIQEGPFELQKELSSAHPFAIVNTIAGTKPEVIRSVDAPAVGPSWVIRDTTGAVVDTLEFFSTFDSYDFDSRFLYATTPMWFDPYDRELVAFDVWGNGIGSLYSGGDQLGSALDGTVRSQGKYLYVLDDLLAPDWAPQRKARLRIYEKATGCKPDPVHPVRIFPQSDAYKLGQSVGVSLAVGCPISVHIELLEDGNVVNQVSTQNFAIADDVARSVVWPLSCSTAHLENHSYTFRAIATYSDNTTSTFLSDPFRIEIGAKREVAIGGGKPFTSIQAAVNASASGDSVIVYTGNYSETLTLKSNVRVIGKPGASIVVGISAAAVSVSAAVFPPTVDGLEFHAASGAKKRAISVSGCGIQVKNCTFNSLAGADSISSGHAAFTNCTFANNSGATGGAVWLDADALQATTFTDCQFTNNFASVRGGAVYLGSTGSYSASAPRVSFLRCTFTGNSAPEAAAVRVGVNRRPSFDHCVFASNHPTATAGGSVIGGAGGVSATFQNCTFASNSSSQSFDVIRLEPGGTVPLPTIDATIFANNSGGNALGSSYGGTYGVAHSDFLGNSAGDATWAASGTGNFSENPAFCPGTDYTIYAFSPCVPGVKYASLVGAKDVACVPNATVTVLPGGTNPPDNYLLVCPAGDGDKLDVQVALDPSVMTRAPEARELTIEGPYSASGIYTDKTITSEAAATAPNYVMRISHRYLSGYTWLPLKVYLNGHALAPTALIKRRSADIVGLVTPTGTFPDGKISLPDYSRWSIGFPVGNSSIPYDSLSDIDANHTVDLADFGKFCMHYGQHPEHDQPFLLPNFQMTVPSQTAVSSANVTMQFTEEYVTSTDRRLNVDLALDEATGATACIFAVKTNRDDLRFLQWEKANGNVVFADVKVDSVEQLYVGTIYRSAYNKAKESLGQLVFDVEGTAPINIADDEFILTVGDIELMGENNQTYGAKLSGVLGRTIKGSVQKLFHNRLEQNFPNPFNPQTTIAFSIKKASNVRLAIYDVTGARVRDLVDEKRVPGAYRVVWDGRSQNGNQVASGVYFYKLTAGGFTSAKKMVLLK